MKIVVTSGQPFTDIDALACAVAYAELLRLTKKDAVAILPGPLNKTITEKIRKWKLNYSTKPYSKNANYILVDISDPEYFAKFVKPKNIIEIFDHRYGFEDYWKVKLGKNAKIEMVGACVTLIWEEFKKNNKETNISEISANLLYTAIISNTLNFQASVTTNRDKKAYKEIFRYTKLPHNWTKTYFMYQDKETDENIKSAIINDTKNIDPIIGQLELWDSKTIILRHLKEIEEALLGFGRPNWFLTAPSISEGKNYLFTKNPYVKRLLEKTISAKFDGDIGETKKLWLRKEILKELQE
ncbi:hypothetical protein A2715_00520 [Candidatus Woesebacteria bacterium RIFCSPHIGHO2_01_FULL_39_32]|uniref:Uncharacterized protein n=1 Tax=Candidatus Woesebacteria bacterium RIFCSPLOWO2_01_FULL_39_25 TaxID=1802521 RepID=A0A1F8BP13_9BACT|nr:MAG: hypothetical protein A2715_00520 [Candidatus Woesebacteria bacterium RIFCSPHIGHO2_01_FULL_39_32]OGM38150.1 MAG: hypothetical protein A3F01_00685 [Candidatus Woesebacteria bacterium RIFCSPHIGHO2_12_FULL_38_11]OGM65379.1 MAG: hypothetical protein A2893_01475 [Candidatus Woesebacteria bacterium RIFCSPLOWO2_01_FULL_39_25]